MESTGVDGKPVYYLLEEDFTVLLVNEAHITNLPGRGAEEGDRSGGPFDPSASVITCSPDRSLALNPERPLWRNGKRIAPSGET